MVAKVSQTASRNGKRKKGTQLLLASDVGEGKINKFW